MSQGTDASKDAESAAQPSETQPAESTAQSSETQPAEARAKGSETSSSSPEGEADWPIPETEEALNVPKNETVGMLAAISALTLILWFAARLACNAHPDQVREPKHFSTRELTADPKNAAFEFHHCFETGDFATALDLSTGELQKTVEGKLIECENQPDACADNQKALEGSINSTATVLEQTPTAATVELVSIYRKALEPKTFLLMVEKRGEFWRVVARKEVPNRPAASGSTVPVVPAEASAAPTPSNEPAAAVPTPSADTAAPASPAEH